jgi:short-subunit dehydrogenase
LRSELARDGVHVLIVSPGAIQTEFRRNLIADRIQYGSMARQTMTADRCAEIIVEAMRRRKGEALITAQSRLLVWANRLVPWAVDWVLRRYVARTISSSPAFQGEGGSSSSRTG